LLALLALWRPGWATPGAACACGSAPPPRGACWLPDATREGHAEYILRRRWLYGVLILLGVNLATFFLFFTVNTPDDMARLNIGGKRVTHRADREVEGRARL
jgi:hypothetical protein